MGAADLTCRDCGRANVTYLVATAAASGEEHPQTYAFCTDCRSRLAATASDAGDVALCAQCGAALDDEHLRIVERRPGAQPAETLLCLSCLGTLPDIAPDPR